ncbi:hypothetical protein IU427_04950 [Nocardia beijingensis]|uniref:hypothetical protein n=1 Tax=Nocardia beijingensis TaxID=95162 RepID=UPI001894D8E9|nr:hypothetical protein [Nocardia beijingensis]MBF6464529.1 hypothetical protein [Nocardia beijingensis]
MPEIENHDHLDREPTRDREHVSDRIIDVGRWTNRVNVSVAERESMPQYRIGMP